MICGTCGLGNVTWNHSLTATSCPDCGVKNQHVGNEEGEICRRRGCAGILAYPRVENCSCHISPPCTACVENAVRCPECDWSPA